MRIAPDPRLVINGRRPSGAHLAQRKDDRQTIKAWGPLARTAARTSRGGHPGGKALRMDGTDARLRLLALAARRD
jgi:hypothetical protein